MLFVALFIQHINIYIRFTDNSFVSFTNAFVADNIKKKWNNAEHNWI